MMVPDFSVYFDVKSLSFAKLNPHNIQTTVFAKISIYRQKYCSAYVVKKLVWNTMSSSCCANHNVKNGATIYNSELKTSCKKGNTGHNLFQ